MRRGVLRAGECPGMAGAEQVGAAGRAVQQRPASEHGWWLPGRLQQRDGAKVCPGVASTRTRSAGLAAMTSPSETGTRPKATGSAALTW